MQQNILKSTLQHPGQAELLIFSTGGTIAMQPSADGGVAPADFSIPSLSGLPSNIKITEIAWGNLPSPHMTLKHMLQLAVDIDNALSTESVHGAVVLHGTDLLPETAFVLELCLKTSKPVVITGSMRHMNEAGYDGWRNLKNALRLCLAVPSGSEITATMADEIYAAKNIIKTNSIAANSISSIPGMLGRIIENEIILYQYPAFAFYHPFKANELLQTEIPEAYLLTAFPGMNGDLIDALLEKGIKGLVIEGFGAGNIPPALAKRIVQAAEDGIFVLLSTRCPGGGAHPIYAYPGGGGELAGKGVILTGQTTSTKALLFLQLALASNFTYTQIKDFFSYN